MISKITRDYAVKCHSAINQQYDSYLPYEFHLRIVVRIANKFKHLVPENIFDMIEAGCWGHDVIEDTGQSYNDVKDACGTYVADLVFALTNEKGKSRKERGGEKYYEGIRNALYAPFIKLCDRIGNVEYGKMTDSKMTSMYRKENEVFCKSISCNETERYAEMFEYLNSLLNDATVNSQTPISQSQQINKMKDALIAIMINILPRAFLGDGVFKQGVLSNIEMALGKEEYLKQEQLHRP